MKYFIMFFFMFGSSVQCHATDEFSLDDYHNIYRATLNYIWKNKTPREKDSNKPDAVAFIEFSNEFLGKTYPDDKLIEEFSPYVTIKKYSDLNDQNCEGVLELIRIDQILSPSEIEIKVTHIYPGLSHVFGVMLNATKKNDSWNVTQTSYVSGMAIDKIYCFGKAL